MIGQDPLIGFVEFGRHDDIVIKPISSENMFEISLRPKKGKWRVIANLLRTGDLGIIVKDVWLQHSDHYTTKITSPDYSVIQVGDTPSLFVGKEEAYENINLVPEELKIDHEDEFVYSNELGFESLWQEYYLTELYRNATGIVLCPEHKFFISKIGYGGGQVKTKLKFDKHGELVQIGMYFLERPVQKINMLYNRYKKEGHI